MLELVITDVDGTTVELQFEHSLRTLSKWESKYCVAFMGSSEKSTEQLIDYFKCMLLTDVDPNVVYLLSPEHIQRLKTYIDTPQTASSVPNDGPQEYDPEVKTSELIYFWMTALRINWEAQDWHLSRLLMLIQITSYKQQPPKKRSKREVVTDMVAENERRLKLLQTSG